MSWKDTYDYLNMTWEGELYAFGDHYTTEDIEKIIEEEQYDEPGDYYAGDFVWVRFCCIRDDEGDVVSGWLVLSNRPKSMKGCIKATEVIIR